MDKLVSISFAAFIALVCLLRRAAERAAAVLPGMLDRLEPDIAHRIVKMADRETAVRVL